MRYGWRSIIGEGLVLHIIITLQLSVKYES